MQKQPINYAKHPRTVKQLNKIIQLHFPNVLVFKDKKRFCLHSDHPATETKILSLYSRAVYVIGVNYLSFEEWVSNIQSLFNEDEAPQRVH